MTDLYKDTPYAESAISMMERHGVTMTPENYTVWYAHASGQNPALSRLIDVYESNAEPFTQERNLELYERFCAPQSQAEAIHDVGQRLNKTIGQIMGNVHENLESTAAFGNLLSHLNAEMENPLEQSKVLDLVAKLRAETDFMHNRIHALEERLSAGSKEITDLKKRLNEVQREANTDALTMVANRKRFDAELRSQAAQSAEDSTSLCLVLIDIDHFKSFNDTHGHQIGDLVLRLVARTLDLSTKGQDLVARYGGEEFAIILPETTLQDATQLANRIRLKMAESRIRLKERDKNLGRVTVSAGVALYEHGEPLPRLIERADHCLYQAKNQGRNQVVAQATEEDFMMAAAE
jgi:diguanylate cyclase